MRKLRRGADHLRDLVDAAKFSPVVRVTNECGIGAEVGAKIAPEIEHHVVVFAIHGARLPECDRRVTVETRLAGRVKIARARRRRTVERCACW